MGSFSFTRAYSAGVTIDDADRDPSPATCPSNSA